MDDERRRSPATFALGARLGAGLAAALLAAADANAAQDQARFTVSAVVAAHASLAVRSQPEALTVRAEDVARGYVDAPAATELEIGSNSREGYVLAVIAGLPGATGVEIAGLGAATVSLDAAGGSIVQHWSTPAHLERVTLRFRFRLSPEVMPGRYPWPLHLDAIPL